jgi:hypothetical protein
MTNTPVEISSTNIKIEGGRIDAGARNRALLVAKALHNAGLWDGVEEITINNPYRAYDLMAAPTEGIAGVNAQPAHDLILGIDYRFQSREFRPGSSIDTSKPYLITPEQYREGEYGNRRRDGLLTIHARRNGKLRPVRHVTYDDEQQAYYVWFLGVEKPQMVDNVYRLEVVPHLVLDESVEPRSVNKTTVAVTGFCKYCGQQYDGVFDREIYELAGLEHLLRIENTISCCPICYSLIPDAIAEEPRRMVEAVQPLQTVIVVPDNSTDHFITRAKHEIPEAQTPRAAPQSKHAVIHTIYQKLGDDSQRRDADGEVNRYLALDWSLFQITDDTTDLARIVTFIGNEGQPLPDGEQEAAIDYTAMNGGHREPEYSF